MLRLILLLVAAALAGCSGPDDPEFTCQQACDIADPGKAGVSCDVAGAPGQDTSPPNDYGGCYCTTDGLCPPGWQPHR